MNQILKIVFTGGGSGGHIYPLLAVAEELKKISNEKGVGLDLHYVGVYANDHDVYFQEGLIGVHPILAAKFRRYFSILNIIDVPIFFISIFQALFKLFWLMPDVVFSKGGPGAYPVVLAAWFYRIPILIHESDAVPGLTNLLSRRFAKRIAVSFEIAARYFDPNKTAVTGNPVRKSLVQNIMPSNIAKEELGFNSGEPLLLILGGSQGARRINDFILANFDQLIKETQILHQTGVANFIDVKNLSRAALVDMPIQTELQHRYEPVSYFEQNLAIALSAADLVVARAGSGTIFELAAFRKPVILIPLSEAAGDHQRINAYEFAKLGGGVVIEESNLFPGIFINQIKEILGNLVKLQKMQEASYKFYKPEAVSLIAEEIIRIGGY
jgi:UDP-N-acetylglucosamine--N-acetylmuramyl-(pentapeptide) pyrophosphoryl-undecaprenol N-acetylglucosamine transferase